MNKAQWSIIKAGALFFVVQGLFPPWKLVSRVVHTKETGTRGFAFILTPPPPNPNALRFADLHTQIDWSLLIQLWAVTALVVATLCLIFRMREGEADEGFFQRLRKRRLLSSLVVGFGAPIPLVGVPPPILVAALFIEGFGHVWLLVPLIAGASFVGCTVLSFVFFVLVQKVKSFRTKTAVMVVAGLVLFGCSILVPVITNAREHRDRYQVYNSKLGAYRTLESLNRALATYKAQHGMYPSNLADLALPSLLSQDRYKLEYQPRNSSGSGPLDSYAIYADPLDNDNRYGWPVHFYTDETCVVRECIMCSRAGPEDFVFK